MRLHEAVRVRGVPPLTAPGVPAGAGVRTLVALIALCAGLAQGSATAGRAVSIDGSQPRRPAPTSGVLSPEEAEERIKQLVVMIRGDIAGTETIGAGIIFGVGQDRLYIATANHVVRQGTDEGQNLRVELRWLPGEPVEAVLLSHADPDLDLAVLSVANLRRLVLPRLPFDRLGTPSLLKRRDFVYFVGFPNGKPWHTRVTPDPISQTSAEAVRFESTFLAQGHSGGALLDRQWQLVGMIRGDQPPEGDAVSIDRVLEKLREWNYPVRLTQPPAGTPTPPDTTTSPDTGTTAIIDGFGMGTIDGAPALCYFVRNAVTARIDPDIGELDPSTLRKNCVPIRSRSTDTYTLVAVGRDKRAVSRRLVTGTSGTTPEPFRVTDVWADTRTMSDTGGAEIRSSFVGPCPKEFLFIGAITANGPGPVLYRWERSDGIVGETLQLEFTRAGTMKPEYYRWTLGRSDPSYNRTIEASVTLVVTRPNRMVSKPASFHLECRNR